MVMVEEICWPLRVNNVRVLNLRVPVSYEDDEYNGDAGAVGIH
jgi:hypothetical protein